MKNKLLFLLIFISSTTFSQSTSFSKAYLENPYVTDGILETVSYTRTRMMEIDKTSPNSCMGTPTPYGIMGLHENGKNYFWENGKIVAYLSGISIFEQKQSIDKQILSYAIAYNSLMQSICDSVDERNNPLKIYAVLKQLSEIPETGMVNKFAIDAQIFEILTLLNSTEFCSKYKLIPFNFNLRVVFNENHELLKSKKITINEKTISDENKNEYKAIKSNDYSAAIWNPSPTCNFSSRNGTSISAITIHTTQGSYSGAISWAQNCNSNVSFHYIIRSSDGQITQLVHENDKAWHVGSQNSYTIGIEHEGWVNDPSWYTNEMYTSSSNLCKDIINSGYGIPAHRTYYGASSSTLQTLGNCTKIKGHQHYQGQTHTDPGINWDWERFYRLLNDTTSININNSVNGSFYDTGGPNANYSDDERIYWLIEPANATSINLDFSFFSLEQDYDYLYIYDGDSDSSPLIGTYTGGNSPGNITSSTGSLFFEFRSDCATTSKGWDATYSSNGNNAENETISLNNISVFPNPATNGINVKNIKTNTNYSIINTEGKILLVGKINNDMFIPLDLKSGAYHLKLESNGVKRITTFFIKK
ncbi:MAG: N-acetylmuramoyl-L-alanine amidase [Crocinitomicaceae bacterium]|nr:N-acetylmuramoyl-L-alanine amidase [Crocinitomicaceae bacterium]